MYLPVATTTVSSAFGRASGIAFDFFIFAMIWKMFCKNTKLFQKYKTFLFFVLSRLHIFLLHCKNNRSKHSAFPDNLLQCVIFQKFILTVKKSINTTGSFDKGSPVHFGWIIFWLLLLQWTVLRFEINARFRYCRTNRAPCMDADFRRFKRFSAKQAACTNGSRFAKQLPILPVECFYWYAVNTLP